MRRIAKKQFFNRVLKNYFFIKTTDPNFNTEINKEVNELEEEYLEYYRKTTRWQTI